MTVLPELTRHSVLLRFSLVLTTLLLSFVGANTQTYRLIRDFGLVNQATGSAPLWPLVLGPDGALYGTTSGGALSLRGSVFKVRPDGSGFAILKTFTNSVEGLSPNTSVVISGNTLYGTTSTGGELNAGTLFKVNLDGSSFSVVSSLPNAPGGELALVNDRIFGTAETRLFAIDLDGSNYQVLRAWPTQRSLSGVIQYGDYLWGTLLDTVSSIDAGSVFRIKPDGTDYVTYTIDCVTEGVRSICGKDPGTAGVLVHDNKFFVPTVKQALQNEGTLYGKSIDGSTFENGLLSKYLHVFGDTNQAPNATLTRISNSLFGTTADDSIFRTDLNGGNFAIIKRFSADGNGFDPNGRLLAIGETLYGVASRGGLHDGGVVYSINSDGSNYAVLAHFNGTADGNTLYSGLASDGAFLYGTTFQGGSSNSGTIFRINPDGSSYTQLKNFFGPDGRNPQAGVVVAAGALYGTTSFGGASNSGVIFRLNADGSNYTILTNLTPATGALPYGTLAFDGDYLFGTTSTGGVHNAGTVFRIAPNGGGYTVLHDFAEPEGQTPFAGLLLADNTLYGTTFRGGSNHFGTVFKINTDGSGFAVLKHFNQNDGSYPRSALTLDEGTLYGTTSQGGVNNLGVIFSINTSGENFTVKRSFTAADGYNPHTGLVLIDSTLYGTTFNGGAENGGTLYKINTDGRGFAILTNVAVTTGLHSQGELLLLNGTLYGTTSAGGQSNGGVLYAINLTGAEPIALTFDKAQNQVVLTWQGSDFQLQNAPAVVGPYSDVAASFSPYTVAANGSAQFFRLVKRQP